MVRVSWVPLLNLKLLGLLFIILAEILLQFLCQYLFIKRMERTYPQKERVVDGPYVQTHNVPCGCFFGMDIPKNSSPILVENMLIMLKKI